MSTPIGIKIQLDEDHVLTTDSMNWILNESRTVQKGDNVGGKYYKSIANTATIDRVISIWIERRKRGINATSMEELNEGLLALANEVEKLTCKIKVECDEKENVSS